MLLLFNNFKGVLMKQFYLLLIAFALMFSAQQANAQSKKFGLGVMLGEPTGLSGKLWTGNNNALAFGLGWSTYHPRYNDNGTHVHFHLDYLWHTFDAIRSEENFAFHYGIGARFKDRGGDNGSIAVRGVFGLNWLPSDMPIDIFLEIAPSLELTPSTGFAIDGALGARFYF
jgi:hypothetical protein